MAAFPALQADKVDPAQAAGCCIEADARLAISTQHTLSINALNHHNMAL
jgi:hypothetical protein